jgi:hypothetical protein
MAWPKSSSIRGGPNPKDQQEEREARIAGGLHGQMPTNGQLDARSKNGVVRRAIRF